MDSDYQQFTNITDHYDALMAGVPYHLWVDYLEEILKRLDYQPNTVFDLACGTGSVSELMAERGYDVVGADIAAGMIEVAKRKTAKSGANIEYLVQDACELNLGRKFDLVISLFDSLNYITDESKLALAMERVSEHLVDGGYFIFDVNTEYAFAHGFFNQSNIGSGTYPKYVWVSTYDRTSRICSVNMVFEAQEPDGTRHQFTEIHEQKAYRMEELDKMLFDAGLETVARYHAYKFKQPTRRSDRVFFVARKK